MKHRKGIQVMLGNAFITYFGTVLCRSPNGVFYHCQIEEAYVPWIYKKDHNISIVKKENDTNLYLNCNQKREFLSAHPGGNISFTRNQAGWEVFRTIDMHALISMKKEKLSIPIKQTNYKVSKIIHQIGNESEIPEIFLENVDFIKKTNPGWEYRYWSEKDRHDFIYTYYGWDILKYYLSINRAYGAARADFFRYLCIYQMGGVYLDLKSRNSKPFDAILQEDDEYLLSQWDHSEGSPFRNWGLGPEINFIPGGEYQQWHIIARSGHPFLENVIESTISRIRHYSEALYSTGRLGVLRVTGPYVYSTAIFPILNQHKHRIFDYEKAGLVYSCVHNHTNVLGRHYSEITMPVIL